MGGFTVRQGPEENLDYQLDWSAWLPQSDTIIGSTWTADVITLGDDFYTDTTTTVWVSAVPLGGSSQAVNQITTAAGRIGEQTILFRGTVQ